MVLRNLPQDIWNLLLRKIDADQCTPFLGAGACYGSIPMGKEIANTLAAANQYPLLDKDNLIAVSQFLAIKEDPVDAKRQFVKQFIANAKPPEFDKDNEPHGTLAKIPVSVYMTTNYDDFMSLALEKEQYRQPHRFECQWHDAAQNTTTTLPDDFEPNTGSPLVFHLHGYSKPEHLVLTEDDYLKFLTHMARNPNLLPNQITSKLKGSSLLFVGYSLSDWNFRILFENLRSVFKHKSIAVLLPPGETPQEKQNAMDYLDEYYRRALELKIYWGTAREFCGELLRKWQDYETKKNN